MDDRLNTNDAWFAFVSKYLDEDVAVIFSDERGPRPRIPYVALKIISGPTPLGSMDELRPSGNDDNFYVSGHRQFTMNIQGFGSKGFDSLDRIMSLLDSPMHGQFLRSENDIAIVDKGAVTDITELLETGFERRGTMDVIFNEVRNLEVEVGEIRKVNIGGEIQEAKTGSIIIETFDVEKP